MPFWSRNQAESSATRERSNRDLILDTYALLNKLQRQLRTEQYIRLSRAQRGQIMGNIKRGISAKEMDIYFKRDLRMIDDSRDRSSANLESHKVWALQIFDVLPVDKQREYASEFLRVSADLYSAATGDPDTAGINGTKARLIFYHHLFDLEEMHREGVINDAMLELGMTALYNACRIHFLAYEGVPELIEQWLYNRSDCEAARESLEKINQEAQ